MSATTFGSRKTHSIRVLLDEAVERLLAHGVENPTLNAERLLCQIFGIRRVDLYVEAERVYAFEFAQEFRSLVARRCAGEPLQYIVGEAEFMSLPFKTDRRALIPRPETEILVEHVLCWCKTRSAGSKTVKMLEIGAGSGCIAVSLAKYLPAAQVLAVDVTEEALSLARENARLNGVANQVEFMQADYLDDHFAPTLGQKFDAVVSNPPYVSLEDYSQLPAEIREFEPEIALHDGGDGTSFYRRLTEAAPAVLRKGGLLAVEVGLGQARAVESLFDRNGFRRITSLADLNDIKRVVSGECGRYF